MISFKEFSTKYLNNPDFWSDLVKISSIISDDDFG